jgi:hypothetical protein
VAFREKIIAPACTLKLVPKNFPPSSAAPEENRIPKGSHWVDETEPGSIVVIDQPEGQSCAAVGGIMAQRMKMRGVAGCVVGGRVRDMAELEASQLAVCLPVLQNLQCRLEEADSGADLRPRQIDRWHQRRINGVCTQYSGIDLWGASIACGYRPTSLRPSID